VTVGMMLDSASGAGRVPAGDAAVRAARRREVRADRAAGVRVRQRTGHRVARRIALAQAGEFGFVLLSLAAPTRVVPEPVLAGPARRHDPFDARDAVSHRGERSHRHAPVGRGMDAALARDASHRGRSRSRSSATSSSWATGATGSALRCCSKPKACVTSRSISIRSACARRRSPATRWFSPTARVARRWSQRHRAGCGRGRDVRRRRRRGARARPHPRV